jgi:AraC-like DNA-binding protein
MIQRVERAPDLEAFLRDPVGRYVAGRAFFRFCASRDLSGYVIWGDLGEADLRALEAQVAVEAKGDAPPHRSLVDLRRVTSIDPSGLAILRGAVAELGRHLGQKIITMVLVRPDNLVGAVLEGIQSLVTFAHPVEVVADMNEAFELLGIADRGLVEELATVHRGLQPAARLVVDLHAVFESGGPDMALSAVAGALKLSARSLQRRLHDVGTRFQRERNLAQVRRAQRLIVETDATLSEIALEVGCHSLQHFSTLFRRITGRTPSDWRAEERAGRA